MPAPIIESERLVLRPWRDSDIEGWVEMNADPRVTEFLAREYTRAMSEASAVAMREALERKGYGWWVVDVRGGPEFAGVVALQEVPFEAPFTPANEIGWRFPVAIWGHGYATEGARAALAFAFATLGWGEVVAFTAASNVRSQRVMDRLGMTRDLADDFDHPRLPAEHRLLRHHLYRIRSR